MKKTIKVYFPLRDDPDLGSGYTFVEIPAKRFWFEMNGQLLEFGYHKQVLDCFRWGYVQGRNWVITHVETGHIFAGLPKKTKSLCKEARAVREVAQKVKVHGYDKISSLIEKAKEEMANSTYLDVCEEKIISAHESTPPIQPVGDSNGNTLVAPTA